MTDLKKVLFLYRQSNNSTHGVNQGEGGRLVWENGEEGVLEGVMEGVVEEKNCETVLDIHNAVGSFAIKT